MIVVDEPVAWPWRGGTRRFCHMASTLHNAAGLAELHQMADQLGLRREWFQARQFYPHYDITGRKRNLALKLGATAIEAADLVRLCKWTEQEMLACPYGSKAIDRRSE